MPLQCIASIAAELIRAKVTCRRKSILDKGTVVKQESAINFLTIRRDLDPTFKRTENDGDDRCGTSDHPTDPYPRPAPFYASLQPYDAMTQPHTPHPLVMHTKCRTPQQSPFDQDLPVHTGLEVLEDFPPHETDTTRFGMRQFTHPKGHGPARVGLNGSGGDGRVVGYAVARRSSGGHAHAAAPVLCIAVSIVAGRGQRGQGLGGRVGKRRGETFGAV